MNSSAKIDNRKKDLLIHGKGPTQELQHALSSEEVYSSNFKEHNKNNLFELAL